MPGVNCSKYMKFSQMHNLDQVVLMEDNIDHKLGFVVV